MNTLEFTELARFKLYDVNFNKQGLERIPNGSKFIEVRYFSKKNFENLTEFFFFFRVFL